MEAVVAVQLLDHPVLQVFSELRRIDEGVRDAIAESLPYDLTVPQFEVLRLLDLRGDGASPVEIAQALFATKSNMTATLQRLESSGFVQIEPCRDDGRKKRVRTTDAGRRAFTEAAANIRPKMEHLREAFTMDEFREALPFLKALRAWFEERDWAEPAPVRAAGGTRV
jgi:DNA-binding MarR family transcriptional regulator